MPRSISVALVFTVALTLAACGTRTKQSNGVAGASTAMTSGQQVTATESEFKIQLSSMQLKPGATTFVAENKGKVAHSLEINGPGVSDQRISGTIPPGGSRQLHVVLQSGTYDIFCPVDGHRGLGMNITVTVGSGGMGGTPPTTTMSSSGGGGY